MILKKATNKNLYRRSWFRTQSAREAWSQIIDIYKSKHPKGIILLPSYIGWSKNEGSGIFDCVRNSGLSFDFYNLDVNLEIDLDDLFSKLDANSNPLILLVHYFGFVDKSYEKIISKLQNNRCFIIEDCAHAWLSDIIGGTCGRAGNFSFYSLHKILALNEGGLLVDNFNSLISISENRVQPIFDLNYDLLFIFQKRRNNYIRLLELLKNIGGIRILRTELPEGICPQTLPIELLEYDRDKLYHEMNELGFGLVSLYHTMIPELKGNLSLAAEVLSRNIINLPVHQDISFKELEKLVTNLIKIISK